MPERAPPTPVMLAGQKRTIRAGWQATSERRRRDSDLKSRRIALALTMASIAIFIVVLAIRSAAN